MAKAKPKEMTADEFLIWSLSQECRFELVDGSPVPLRAMTGASTTHDLIVVNLIALLRQQLRGTNCRPVTPDVGIRTAIKQVRRPDVMIDCAPPDAKIYEARNPIAVFEILSPTTRKHDRTMKLAEYMRHPTLRAIVHIDPDVMDIVEYRRDNEHGWLPVVLIFPEMFVAIDGTPVKLALADIYDGVPLAPTDDAKAE
jgi:Uma2 family endonuclease